VPRFGPADVGSRVSVRVHAPDVVRPDGRPRFRDVVGTLVSLDGHAWRVRRRDGSEVTIAPDTVVAARIVPDTSTRLRRAVDVDTATLEQIAAAGWQPLESEPLGGWVLRAANGFTGRANSTLALTDPGCDWSTALDRVARWYRARRLVPTVQVALPWAQTLDDRLAAAGWVAESPVRVQVVDITAALMARDPGGHLPPVTFSDRPSSAWTSVYRYAGAPLPAEAQEVLTRAEHPVFALVTVPDDPPTPAAIARGALTPGWLGITAVDVAEAFRRRGLGRHVVLGLLHHAQRHGARFSYLQVAEDNVAARALYAQLGFVDHHRYHYRRLYAPPP
jgi:N-acetylglutamate synthase